MPALTERSRRLLVAAEGFDPRGLGLAISRSLLGAAALTSILFTPDHKLFTYTDAVPAGVYCDGVRGISIWCLIGPSPTGLITSRVLVLVVLGAVMIGLSPRWTCIPHWYVTFSLASSMTLPNGGEYVASICTLLLIPLCLGDTRVWQWTPPATPLRGTWRGAAYAAILILRVQVAIVYGEAFLSKMAVPEWRNGTAMYSVLADPDYGLPTALQRLVSPAMRQFWVIAGLTWGTLLAEALIACLLLGPIASRRAAVKLAFALHVAIIVLLGLFSFGLIMIAAVLAASSLDLRRGSLQAGSHLGGRQLKHDHNDYSAGERQPPLVIADDRP